MTAADCFVEMGFCLQLYRYDAPTATRMAKTSPRRTAHLMDDDDDDALAEKIAALRALHASDKKGNELAAQLMSDMPAPPPKEVLKAVKPRPPRKEADMPRLESLPRREPPAKDAGTPRGNETLSRRDALAKALEATWLESADEKEARLLKAAQGTLAAPKAAHDDESKPSVQRARRRESSASRCAARPADDEATEREKEVARLAAGAAKLRLQLAATEKAKLEQERLKEVDQMYARLKEKEVERKRHFDEERMQHEAERSAADEARRQAHAARRAAQAATARRREAAAARAEQAKDVDAAEKERAAAEEKKRHAAEQAEAARLAAEARLKEAAKERAAQRRAELAAQKEEEEARRSQRADSAVARVGRRQADEREQARRQDAVFAQAALRADDIDRQKARGDALFAQAAKRAAARYDFATIELVRAPTREDRDHDFAQFMRRERMKKEGRKRPEYLQEQPWPQQQQQQPAWADDHALHELMSSALQPVTQQPRLVSSAPLVTKAPAADGSAPAPLAARLAARRADAPKGAAGGWSDWS